MKLTYENTIDDVIAFNEALKQRMSRLYPGYLHGSR